MGFLDWLTNGQQDSTNDAITSIRINYNEYDRKQAPKYDKEIGEYIRKLATFYRKYGGKYANNNISQDVFINKVAPSSNSHTCPHCGVIHEFTASRARKCPDCGEKMIVRSGRYLTQKQVDSIEKLARSYYDKSYWADRLKTYIESAQSYQKDFDYAKALIAIAEGFQACAIIHNKTHPEDRGFSFWDYSWKVLQEATMAATQMSNGKSNDIWVWNGYLDSLYSKGEHCMRELKYTESIKSKGHYAAIATNAYYMFLAESIKFNDKANWRREDAIKMIYVARELAGFDEGDIEKMNNIAIDSSKKHDMKTQIREAINEVDTYVFLETDHDRLMWMIH